MKKTDLKKQVSGAISACLDKKAEDLTLLELEQGTGAFTDYFVICRGTHHRMDWQDEEPRDPISHRRLPKTSEAIRRCRWDSPQRRTGFTEAVWPRRPQHATLARASGFTRKAVVIRRAGGLHSWTSG